LAAANAPGAALVGHSQGDLLRELAATHENLAASGGGTDTVQLTASLGLSDTAFVIGAKQHRFLGQSRSAYG
jgi:hypothetical protein